jgi:hypothetical protein
MKTIYGEYFACGYAFTAESEGVFIDGVAVDKFQEWIDIETKAKVLGVYPKNISGSDKYVDETLKLDVYKVIADGKEVYFGCYEARMCWYLFYKFKKEDIAKIKN